MGKINGKLNILEFFVIQERDIRNNWGLALYNSQFNIYLVDVIENKVKLQKIICNYVELN